MAKGSGAETLNVEYTEGIHALSEEHRQYLLQRHGTLDLEPVPDMTDNDPYNWPKHKKVINLVLVAFHAMMGTFTAAAVQSVFAEIAADFGVSIQSASYMLSLVIAVLGGAPLIWGPISQRFGRRPIFLLSLLCSLAGNIGCAVSPSYSTMAFCRAITGFFISPAIALGSGVVTETFFKKERASYIGVWTIMVTLGVPVAPLIFGFVSVRVGYLWIYWIMAIVNGVQFILGFFLLSESRYIRNSVPACTPQLSASVNGRSFGSLLSVRRIDPTPLSWWDFVRPLSFVTRPCVIIPAFAYAMVFLWANIVMTVETGSLFPEKFGLNPEQVGLQNISLIVGSLIGELMGGFLSDWWMWRRQSKNEKNSAAVDSEGSEGHHAPQPEFRLWVGYPGLLLAICGVVVYLVQLDRAGDTWNITPIIGAGIAAVGNQIVTTVATTYAVDCYRESAADVGVFVCFVRQMWGFIGPFWFPQMILEAGFRPSAGIATAMLVGASLIPMVVVQWKGRSWR